MGAKTEVVTDGRGRRLLRACWGGLAAWSRSGWQDLRSALAVDRFLLVLLLVYAILWVPLIPRSTDNPQHLAAFINDEPMITQQLVGMTLPPYGNPANLMAHPKKRPAYWGSIQYYKGLYYGGTYLDLAFFVFAPLKLLGVPDFPAAPVILRSVSVVSALLCLVLVYNLGKQIGGRRAGFGGALLLLLDFWFNYYTSIIHPDTTMLTLGLLALWVAIRHVERGDVSSLVTLGLVGGFCQGAKAGGPWLIPLGLVAVCWGTRTLFVDRASSGSGSLKAALRTMLWRASLLALTAVAGFALSTPYAFLNSYYRRTMRSTFTFNRHGPFAEVSYLAWFREIGDYLGPVGVGLVLLALLLVPLRCWKRERPAPLALTAVLLLSILAWYTTTVRLWVVVGYLLPALALAAVLAADVATLPLRWLPRRKLAGRWAAAALLVSGVLVVAYYRWHVPINFALLQHCREHWTVVQVGRWAEENLPHDSKILYDDIAYFDPSVFPNARFHGGLLTYNDLEKHQPDYFLLSGSIYHATYYQKLRQTQHYSRGHEGPFSVLLYQDAVDRGSVPGADLVYKFSNHTPPQDHPLGFAFTWARVALGLDSYSIGGEIRLYRYRPAAAVEEAVAAEEGHSGS